MEESNKNRGVKEQPPFVTDYMVGAESAIIYEERVNDWRPFLSTHERQNIGFETSACTNFAQLNSLEAQLNFLLSKGDFSEEQIAQLKAAGYIQDGEFRLSYNFSDCFLANMSGTTEYGNYVYRGWDSLRKDGALPEADMPMAKSFKEYYDKSRITNAMLTKAKTLLDYIEIKYEWLTRAQLAHELKHAPIQITSPTCPTWKSGTVKTCGQTASTHSTLVVYLDDRIHIEDHYEPFAKTLDLDYPINSFCKGVVTVKNFTPVYTVIQHNFTKDMVLFDKNDEVMMLQEFLKSKGYLKVQPTGYFGYNTLAAVKSYQADHKDEILTPLGLIYPTGNVLKMTRASINKYTNV